MVNATPGGGGGSAFTVDADAISTHGGTVGGIARDIEQQMSLMQRKLSALQGQWTGSASTQFSQLYSDWERQQRSVKETLRQIGLALGQTANDYRDVERGNQARFRV
ncbi:WXG100 family type VII secretion target [Dermacoccaceae bacterium W4C1]